MSEKRPDRRVGRTRKVLHDALISLMLQKDYGSVTIQEIIDRANVGRSTFYTHFDDKDDLLMAGLEGLRDMLQTAQRKAVSPALKPYEKVIGFSLAMFEHALENRILYQALIRSQAGAIVLQKIPVIVAGLIRDEAKLEFRRRRTRDSQVPFDLFVHFIATSFVCVLSWWLESDSPLRPKEIDRVFRALVVPSLAANIE